MENFKQEVQLSLDSQLISTMATIATDITSTFEQILASLADKEKSVITRRIGLT